MTAPEPGRTVPPATANSPSTASAESAIRRCQSVMAAQSGVTQLRVRHGWVGGAHIAADLHGSRIELRRIRDHPYLAI